MASYILLICQGSYITSIANVLNQNFYLTGLLTFKKKKKQLGIVMHTFNHSAMNSEWG